MAGSRFYLRGSAVRGIAFSIYYIETSSAIWERENTSSGKPVRVVVLFVAIVSAMSLDAAMTVPDQIANLYRDESRRVFASLVRLLNDFDLADDAMHEAFAAALERWPRDGVPANPRAWLVSTGRFKAIDSLRRQKRFAELEPEISLRLEDGADTQVAGSDTEIEDDRLRLIFTCCHPAIDPKIRVPLTLREVCGLTTEEIANAFLTLVGFREGPHVDLGADGQAVLAIRRVVHLRTDTDQATFDLVTDEGDDCFQGFMNVLAGRLGPDANHFVRAAREEKGGVRGKDTAGLRRGFRGLQLAERLAPQIPQFRHTQE